MKKIVIILTLFIIAEASHAAHFLEPLNTEIAATPSRWRFFLQAIYTFFRKENEEKIDEHLLPIEIEFGLAEKTQLNLEAEVLIAERENGETEDKGIEEIAIGLKHRFLDEKGYLPDMAFEVEFTPVTELGDGQAVAGTLIFSKFLGRWFIAHVNLGYEFERVEEDDEIEFSHSPFYNLALMFRAIPDRLLLVGELNSKHSFVEDGPTIDELVFVPEFIAVPFTKPTFALKFGVPIGLTDGSSTPDFGIELGISMLF